MIDILIATVAAAEGETDASKMPQEDPTSNWTAVILAVFSLIFYWFFLKPTAVNEPPPPSPNTSSRRLRHNSNNTPQRRPQAPNNTPLVQPDRRLPAPQNLSENALAVLIDCQSKPSFVTTSQDRVGLGGHKALMDGLVAFGHTEASTYSTGNTSEGRTERAKVLSRLGSSKGLSLTAPPSKGSTMVVNLPFWTDKDENNDASKLQQILRVLGSYYNLIVIGSMDPSKPAPSSLKEEQEQQESLQRLLYSDDVLNESILPSHRILLAASKVGRIALVRQLVKVELVVDYQSEVQTELGRFGYKVAIVPQLGKLLDD